MHEEVVDVIQLQIFEVLTNRDTVAVSARSHGPTAASARHLGVAVDDLLRAEPAVHLQAPHRLCSSVVKSKHAKGRGAAREAACVCLSVFLSVFLSVGLSVCLCE